MTAYGCGLAGSLLARLFVKLDHCSAFTLAVFDAVQTSIQGRQLNMDFFEIRRLVLHLLQNPIERLASVPSARFSKPIWKRASTERAGASRFFKVLGCIRDIAVIAQHSPKIKIGFEIVRISLQCS